MLWLFNRISITADGADTRNDRSGSPNRPDPAADMSTGYCFQLVHVMPFFSVLFFALPLIFSTCRILGYIFSFSSPLLMSQRGHRGREQWGCGNFFFFFAFQARILFCFLQVFLSVWGFFFPGILTDLKNVLQPD